MPQTFPPILRSGHHRVTLHASWAIVAVMIIWYFSRIAFPFQFPEMPANETWFWSWLIFAGILLSSLLHESAHLLASTVLKKTSVQSTIFLYGGVNRKAVQPGKPGAELIIAGSGPITSMLLSGTLLLLAFAGVAFAWPRPLQFSLNRLSAINYLIAVANLIPASPFDGGRIMQFALKSQGIESGKLAKIARIAGVFVAILLVSLGNLALIRGQFVSGLWFILLGIITGEGIGSSRAPHASIRSMAGKRIARYIRRNPITVPPKISVRTFITDYLHRYGFELFPVVSYGKPLRAIGVDTIRELTFVEQDKVTVDDVAEIPEFFATPHTNVLEAVTAMSRAGNGRLLAIDDNEELQGILTLKDLLPHLSSWIDMKKV